MGKLSIKWFHQAESPKSRAARLRRHTSPGAAKKFALYDGKEFWIGAGNTPEFLVAFAMKGGD